MNNAGRRINPYREVIFQGDAPECGLACIAMYARLMGRQADIDQLRDKHRVRAEGLSLQDLVSILDGLGLETVPVQFDEDSADALPLPAIVHYGGNHFVLASERAGRFVRILNPATGASIIRARALTFRSAGYALISETETTPMRDPVREHICSPSLFDAINKRSCRLFAAISLLLTSMAFAVPALIQGIWGRHFERWGISDSQTLGVLATLFFMTWLVECWFSRALPDFAASTATWRMPGIFKNLMVRPLAFFELRSPGQLHQRFMAADRVLREHAVTRIEQFVALIFFALSVLLLFVVSKPLACVSVAAFSALGVTAAVFGQRRAGLVRHMEECYAEKSEFVLESIAASHTIRTGELADQRSRRFAVLNLKAIRGDVALKASDRRYGAALGLIANLELIGLFAAGKSLGNLSYGAILTYAFLRMIAMSAASRFSLALIKAKSEKVIDKMAQELVGRPPRPEGSDETPHTYVALSESIVFKHLILQQGAASPSNGLSLLINRRDRVGVAGASGAGKTTLLKIIAGLKPPASGSFSVDGGPDGDAFEALRPLCYMSAAGDRLLRGSLIENVLLEEGREKRSMALRRLEELGLGELLSNLPQGADTQISEERPLMSSGQRQRLFVARALCSSKPVLLFDEPTANLDIESAKRVIRAIATSDKTTIVAMHEPDPQLGIDTWIDLDNCSPGNEPRRGSPCTLAYSS
jgi:ATP-binding cassette subfamily B protein RaxB